MKNIWTIIQKLSLGTILIVLLSFILGWQLGHRDYNLQWKNYRPKFNVTNDQPKDVNLDFKLFWQVWDMLNDKYIDKKALDPQKLYYGAIQGMVSAVGDPYTVFLPPQAQKATKEQLGGSFEGVGMQLGYNKDKRLVVIAPLKDTPADKAGIKSGDIILKIDDQDVSNLSLPEAVTKIKGPKGTKVKLNLYSENDDKPRDVELIRDTIVIKSVLYELKGAEKNKKIGYIRVTQFGEKTKDEWDTAVSQALSDGVQGIIVDVRNNPGGFMEAAVYLGSEFVETGNIVLQEDSKGNQTPFPVVRRGKMLKLPMAVLLNKGSASASEIFSGAMRDHKRASLIGDVSFGKGTIQTAEDLEGGTGIHVTIAKWLTPNATWVHTIGLTPDIKVDIPEGATTDVQLERAIQEVEKKI
jgi:carboxyl-terminal processing protease